MSRGLGKVEKAVLKACCQCFFARDLGKQYVYPGGARLVHPENKAYIRGISIGQRQHRMLLDDEKMIDLKEVHYLYKEKVGKLPMTAQAVIDYGMKEEGQSFEEAKKVAQFASAYTGEKMDTEISSSQEASYQRAVASLRKKAYLIDANFGYAPNRFVKINERKIKPARPKVSVMDANITLKNVG